ncbi:MAG: amidohydrolase family protein [Acidimicrobiales bacterium]
MSSNATMHDTYSLKYAGGVDADGHILEPLDLWQRYIDPKFRDRALKVVMDDDGLEAIELDGKRPKPSGKGTVSTLGAMGAPDLRSIQFDPEKTYDRMAPFGTQDAKQRLAVLDAENMSAAIIYTTVGLLWETDIEDVELTQAHCRAYNRWICEWCSDGEGRLIPSAHVSLSDPAAAAAEVRRAVAEGARGCFVAPFTHDAKPLGHPDHDPLFAACQELDIPFAIHPTFEPQWAKGTRMGPWEFVRQLRLLPLVTASDGVRHQFLTLFDFGVFDRFPQLKVLVLEAGGTWAPYFFDRLDAVYDHTPIGASIKLKRKPSEYLADQIWISCDPDEKSIPHLVERFGDRFLWASDFPHPDHTPAYILDLERNADAMNEASRARFLGDNARELFKLTV